jgi:murein DD-endopeptidase MepM/ murein hydrolase activator NlpD
MERFPLPATASYSYESGFTDRHHGVDIMAPLGTPVLAVERGKAWSSIEPKGGKVVYLEGESGARYFYGHLSEWTLPLISATTSKPLGVAAGDELGRVGNTGNAAGGPPHIHFQIRRVSFFGAEALPGAGLADPFPELMAADPKRAGIARRSSSSSAPATALLLLGILWAWSKR